MRSLDLGSAHPPPLSPSFPSSFLSPHFLTPLHPHSFPRSSPLHPTTLSFSYPSSTHLFIHPPSPSFTFPFLHSPINSYTHSPSPICPFIFMHLSMHHSPIHPPTISFSSYLSSIHPFIYPLSSIHSFIYPSCITHSSLTHPSIHFHD